jgi:hypothetical protein
MGFHRIPQPAPLDRTSLTAEVTRLIAEEIAFARASADPFGVENACPLNPAGHDFIGSCGDVVCCHCSKVAWS